MRKLVLFSCVLLVLAATAVFAGWGLEKGETGYAGEVISVDPKAQSFVISSDLSVTLVQGNEKEKKLKPVQKKAVVVTKDTAIYCRIPGSSKSFSDIKPGRYVYVMGKLAPKGKQFTARDIMVKSKKS